MNQLVHTQMLTAAQSKREALQINAKVLRYEELAAGSSRVASCLLNLHLEPETCIGLYMEKSIEAVLSLYGILRAGAAYVPLDIKNPAQRIEYIVTQCRITKLLTTPEYLEQLTAIIKNIPFSFTIFVVSENVAASENFVASENNENPQNIDSQFQYIYLNPFDLTSASNQLRDTHIPADNLAAILYTSGSTGVPKGVMISHKSIHIFMQWAVKYFNYCQTDRCISHAPLHFDLSLLDIFASHSAGACVVLIPDGMTGNPKFLTQYIASQRVSIWQSVPSALVLLIKYGDINKHHFPHLRHVLFAGERISAALIASLSQHFTESAFHNIYGATETNDTFIYSIPAGATSFQDPLPIGKPLPYVDFLIVDSDNNPVADNAEGELLIKTPTLMRGYRNGAPSAAIAITEINASASTQATPPYYQTRDVVKMLADGNLLFCGRRDDIIKSNGYRINLLEIETLLQSHPSIQDVAVIAVPDDEIGNKIIAIINFPVSVSVSTIELKMFCAKNLPKYAIPYQFDISAAPLPKTSSGKTNKQLLITLRGNHVETA
jgi:amino acid adenylation domain-containing protein